MTGVCYGDGVATRAGDTVAAGDRRRVCEGGGAASAVHAKRQGDASGRGGLCGVEGRGGDGGAVVDIVKHGRCHACHQQLADGKGTEYLDGAKEVI